MTKPLLVKNLPRGEPGLSPDGLYRALVERGFDAFNIKLEVFHVKH